MTDVEHSTEGTVKMVGPLAHFLGTVPTPPPASPALGQHSAEILHDLGFTKEEVNDWRDEGVIG
ncbi:MAG: hypothetical protein CM1200mP22_24940 [Dehalococcoidia bacterium]|nr:MAG: hypothetical protein CM1200mP22_24940 [Dehalococcoidia bacterium]